MDEAESSEDLIDLVMMSSFVEFTQDVSCYANDELVGTSSNRILRLSGCECVEWNSSTKALAEFLAAIGITDNPGKAARYLLEEFGTLSDLLSAPSWRLERVTSRKLARSIRASHDMMRAMLTEQVVDGPLVPRTKELVDLLQAEIGFLKHERLLAIYVDSKCRLMRIECIADGSFDQAFADNRKILGCALAIGAAGFILVHNHPSGVPEPSNADISLTRRLKDLAAGLDLSLLDHFIIARGRLGTIEDYWREARFSREPKGI